MTWGATWSLLCIGQGKSVVSQSGAGMRWKPGIISWPSRRRWFPRRCQIFTRCMTIFASWAMLVRQQTGPKVTDKATQWSRPDGYRKLLYFFLVFEQFARETLLICQSSQLTNYVSSFKLLPKSLVCEVEEETPDWDLVQDVQELEPVTSTVEQKVRIPKVWSAKYTWKKEGGSGGITVDSASFEVAVQEEEKHKTYEKSAIRTDNVAGIAVLDKNSFALTKLRPNPYERKQELRKSWATCWIQLFYLR